MRKKGLKRKEKKRKNASGDDDSDVEQRIKTTVLLNPKRILGADAQMQEPERVKKVCHISKRRELE